MKTKLYGRALLTFVVLLLLTACEETETETVIVYGPTLTTEASVAVAYDGGAYSTRYTIDNPVDGGYLSCTADVSWVSNVDCSVDGVVTFDVAENGGDDFRDCDLSLVYNYDGGYIMKKVGVYQSYATAPVVSVTPTALTAAYTGGTYGFKYELQNAVTGGLLVCNADADWVGNFVFGADGNVSFRVDANDSDIIRDCSITVSYSYSNRVVSAVVGVVQDHLGDDIGFSGSLKDMIGIYEAWGQSYDPDAYGNVVENTWTLTMFANDDDEAVLYIDGMVPRTVGQYPSTIYYLAQGYLDGTKNFIVPSQFTGGMVSSTSSYIGFTPCTAYRVEDGVGKFSYNQTGPPCTFVYNSHEQVWESDYGMFLGTYSSYWDYASFTSYYDVVIPTIKMRKLN